MDIVGMVNSIMFSSARGLLVQAFCSAGIQDFRLNTISHASATYANSSECTHPSQYDFIKTYILDLIHSNAKGCQQKWVSVILCEAIMFISKSDYSFIQHNAAFCKLRDCLNCTCNPFLLPFLDDLSIGSRVQRILQIRLVTQKALPSPSCVNLLRPGIIYSVTTLKSLVSKRNLRHAAFSRNF